MTEKERFQILCNLTFELVKVKHSKCNHLAIENTAPEILSKLLGIFDPPMYVVDSEIDIDNLDSIGKIRQTNES